MQYMSTPARRAILGNERTTNPTPAALFALGKHFGKKRVRRVARALARRRRSFHRGNPAPALIASLASKLPLGGLLKTPSEKRAAKIAGAVVASAVSGNLTAAKAIEARTAIGIAKERAVWQSAWAQVPKRVKDLLKKYGELVPGVDHSTPELAAQEALARPVDANELEEAAAEERRAVRAEAAAGRRESAAAAERRESRLTELGVAGLGALARGGRRRTTRKRRRKSGSRGRSFSF